LEREEAVRSNWIEILQTMRKWRIIGINSLLDVVRIIAAYICVNAAQLELVLLGDFKENMLTKVNAASENMLEVNTASEYQVNAASENMLEVNTTSEYQVKEFDLLKWDQQVVSELIAVNKQNLFLLKDMDQDSTHMVAASKVPMLKPGEYEIWRMRIEQYIQMIDYALWEVIENGETLLKIKIIEGVMTEMPITTDEEKA
ncbi:hypothetical protein Tco_1479086, partial [Tanacetum coccineum]